MGQRLRRALPALIGVLLFGTALAVLHRELAALTWRDLSRDLLATPFTRLGLALLFTVMSYAILAAYDLLGFQSIRKRLPAANVVLASCLSYAIAHSIGFSIVSGASIRYRFYTRWGVTAGELSQLLVSYTVTFWLGVFVLGGISLIVAPPSSILGWPVGAWAPFAGEALIAVPIVFVLMTMVRRAPLTVAGMAMPWPSPGTALLQVIASVSDWAMTAAVLFVLLPSGAISFWAFVGPFLLAVLAGGASHLPGGIGVLEGTLVLLLQPYITSAELVPRLVVYRACYYLLPFAIALVVMTADELRQRRAQAARWSSRLGEITEQITPMLFGSLAFVAGVVLLFSGATPAARGRLDLLHRWLPLGVIEVSHFTGSVVGACLLILSQGLRRRLDSAYYLTATALAVGAAVSLLKGLDYEEAIALVAMFAIFRRARPAFDRRGAFFDTTFSPLWVASVVSAIGASAWLGRFAFKHVSFADQLWWQFELHGQASRSLRAAVGAAMVALVFGVTRLVRRAPHEVTAPTDADLDDAMRIVRAQSDTAPNLVFLRDKGLIFDADRRAFLMYAVQGRTWVALGDPVGPDDAAAGIIRAFLERCDDFGGVPVFYEVSAKHLHRYADVGLTCVKIGEEARVDLARLTLDGPAGAKYRKVIRRLEKDGGRFRVLPADEVPGVLPALRAVSDDWLSARAGSEKGFSLGFFDDGYLMRFPVAVVEVDERVVAFATLWPGADRGELSVDLMRFHHDAPKGTMEALFAHLLVWGQAEGFRWFALGMAPLSGVERSPSASLWNRVGAFVFAHGGRVYNFQGLRAYKEKFDPIWSPRYLAYQGGGHLPRLLADIAALVAGGYQRLFRS
ncbi:MAG: bifunctional lysylphosphatidylglycerol flippase/synthetase MprF [Acidobacteriota bacterium]